jgi:hypothetical protein
LIRWRNLISLSLFLSFSFSFLTTDKKKFGPLQLETKRERENLEEIDYLVTEKNRLKMTVEDMTKEKSVSWEGN